jgi:hypothetical protein
LRKSGGVVDKVSVPGAENKPSVEEKEPVKPGTHAAKASSPDTPELKKITTTQPAKSVSISSPNTSPALGLGLGNYSSEEED